jgi:hypothetical protein
MDFFQMTAPCGRDCFNCPFFIASQNEKYRSILAAKLGTDNEHVICSGCRNVDGNCEALRNYGFSGECKIYQCVMDHKVDFCSDCPNFPCDLLHPLADRAERFPHNLKVFNLCMIKKMGLENWAKNQAKRSADRYYNDKLDTCV